MGYQRASGRSERRENGRTGAEAKMMGEVGSEKGKREAQREEKKKKRK